MVLGGGDGAYYNVTGAWRGHVRSCWAEGGGATLVFDASLLVVVSHFINTVDAA